MGKRWTVAVGGLVVAAGIVSCAGPMGVGGATSGNEHKIKIEYDAKQPNKVDRIKVKKHDGGGPTTFNRCLDSTDMTCKFGHPIGAGLGTITREDGDRRDLNEVYFLSDAASPGRTCVCYGNQCYCN